MQTKVKAFILLSFLSFGSQAATEVALSAKQNCIYPPVSNSKIQAGTPLQFQLEKGTYQISLATNNMSCLNGSLSNGCLIDTVFLQGGLGSSRWGETISKTPTTVTTTGPSTFIAFVSDENCSDNTGYALIHAEKIQ